MIAPGVPHLKNTFTLLQEVGRGSFGIVHIGRDLQDDHEFAVKVLRVDRAPREQLRRETHLMWKLEHPCIVKLHGVYYEDVSFHIVMDLYLGGSMQEGFERHFRNRGRCRATQNCSFIGLRALRSMLAMILGCSAWIHQNGIVHRDLKAANFLLNATRICDEDCRLYLSDFGSACAIAPRQRLNSPCGTASHWAPEVFRRNYGMKADSYAIGVMLIHMLWRVAPVDGQRKDINSSYCTTCMLPCMEHLLDTLHSGLLDVDEAKRWTAKAALNSDILTSELVGLTIKRYTAEPLPADVTAMRLLQTCGSEAHRARLDSVASSEGLPSISESVAMLDQISSTSNWEALQLRTSSVVLEQAIGGYSFEDRRSIASVLL